MLKQQFTFCSVVATINLYSILSQFNESKSLHTGTLAMDLATIVIQGLIEEIVFLLHQLANMKKSSGGSGKSQESELQENCKI